MMQHTQTHSHQKVRSSKRVSISADLKRQSQLQTRRASLPIDQLRPVDIRPAPSSPPSNRMSWPQAHHLQTGTPAFGSILPSPYPLQPVMPPSQEPYTTSYYHPISPLDTSSSRRDLTIQTNIRRNPVRRLSLADLHSPIDNMQTNGPMESPPSPISEPESPPTPPKHSQNGVEITQDEYEALQGFGKFHLREVRRLEKMDLDFKAPNVEEARSHITVNESCERGR